MMTSLRNHLRLIVPAASHDAHGFDLDRFTGNLQVALKLGGEFSPSLLTSIGTGRTEREVYEALRRAFPPTVRIRRPVRRLLYACFLHAAAWKTRLALLQQGRGGTLDVFLCEVKAQRYLTQAFMSLPPNATRAMFEVRHALGWPMKDWLPFIHGPLYVAQAARALNAHGFACFFPAPKEDAELKIDLIARLPQRRLGLAIQIKSRKTLREPQATVLRSCPALPADLEEQARKRVYQQRAFWKGVERFNRNVDLPHASVFLEIGGRPDDETAFDSKTLEQALLSLIQNVKSHVFG